jgi:DNA-binding transcriptional MerR regulator
MSWFGRKKPEDPLDRISYMGSKQLVQVLRDGGFSWEEQRPCYDSERPATGDNEWSIATYPVTKGHTLSPSEEQSVKRMILEKKAQEDAQMRESEKAAREAQAASSQRSSEVDSWLRSNGLSD